MAWHGMWAVHCPGALVLDWKVVTTMCHAINWALPQMQKSTKHLTFWRAVGRNFSGLNIGIFGSFSGCLNRFSSGALWLNRHALGYQFPTGILGDPIHFPGPKIPDASQMLHRCASNSGS